MRKQLIHVILACLLALTGCACGDASNTSQKPNPPPPPPEFSIATYNVHNFFDQKCDSGRCGSGDYEKVLSEEAYQRKLNETVDAIRTIQADVILLQEIETEAIMLDIQANLPDYRAALFGEIGTPASVDVALLAKGEFIRTAKHRSNHTLPDGSNRRLARELLEAEIRLDNGPEITVLTTHFVSKVTDAEGSRRLAEAQLVRRLIEERLQENPNTLLAFGGDLNDTPDSPPITTLTANALLEISTKGMYNVATWRNRYELDYILHNDPLKNKHQYTVIFCNLDPTTGFGSSDHCAVKSIYTASVP
ncbi:MAG: hypothetical protein FWC40_00170 [Proteobacteria bacterium]|nr:hypothetical protein [Pseudomonadota bacterium]